MKSIALPIFLSLLGASAQDNSPTVTTTAASAFTSGVRSSVFSSLIKVTDSSNPPGYTANPGNPSITSVLSDQPELSMLVELLGQDKFSDLMDNIVNHFVSFTFLAPSNDALQEYLGTDAGNMFQTNTTFARNVLSYHVVNGKVSSDDIPQGGILESAWTPTLDFVPNADPGQAGESGQYVGAVKNDDGAYFIGGFLLNSTVQKADLKFNQGYVHVIEKVLTTLGSLTDTLIAGNFQALVGALQQSNIKSQDSLAGPGEQFTLFAPTNQAFLDIAAGLKGLSADQITNILTYHAIPSQAVFADQLKDGMKIPTIGGGNLTINIYGEDEDQRVFVNGARIVAPNLVTNQGVVHGIDEVLNPDVDANVGNNATEGAPQFPGAALSTGITAVPLTSGIPTPTSAIPLPAAVTSLSSYTGAAVPAATGGAALGMMMAGAAMVAAL